MITFNLPTATNFKLQLTWFL